MVTEAAGTAAVDNLTLRLDDFYFDLPEELIAQKPAPHRDESRLLVLNREDGSVHHSRFRDLARWLPTDTTLVINDTRVVPARLWGRRETGGRIEVVLLDPPPPNAGPGEYESECLTRPTRRLKPGTPIIFGPDFRAEVTRLDPSGRTVLNFFFERSPAETLEIFGHMPLPPYIRREADGGPEDALDRERYQTVYARTPGAVAAPTAGLHFTPDLLNGLKDQGVDVASLTLKVSYGTFAPVREQDITRHRLHPERVVPVGNDGRGDQPGQGPGPVRDRSGHHVGPFHGIRRTRHRPVACL